MAELSICFNIKVVLSSILPVDKYPWAEDIKDVPETISKINQQLKSTHKNMRPYILIIILLW